MASTQILTFHPDTYIVFGLFQLYFEGRCWKMKDSFGKALVLDEFTVLTSSLLPTTASKNRATLKCLI